MITKSVLREKTINNEKEFTKNDDAFVADGSRQRGICHSGKKRGCNNTPTQR